MDRRTFMKLLGGLASMPIVGRIAKPLKSETVQEGIASVSEGGMKLYEMVVAKVLKEGTFDPNQKNVIDTIIKGTAPIREDVLVKGTRFDQGELDMAKQKFLTNLNKNKFRRVSKVLVDAAIDGGFGEVVQKICMRKRAKKGGKS